MQHSALAEQAGAKAPHVRRSKIGAVLCLQFGGRRRCAAL